jgi:hypothetical protein
MDKWQSNSNFKQKAGTAPNLGDRDIGREAGPSLFVDE